MERYGWGGTPWERVEVVSVGQLLHSGVRSECYLSELADGRRAVVKLLRQYGDAPAGLYGLISELHFGVDLALDGLRGVFGTGWLDQRPFVAFEYFDGITAARAFGGEQIRDRLFFRRFFQVAVQTVSIVQRLHQQGVVHNNLAPENLLHSRDFTASCLIDFGSAAQVRSSDDFSSFNRLPEGRIESLSPELVGQLMQPLDYSSDLYEIGVLFYYMLTGVFPFTGSPSEVIHAHLALPPLPPEQFISGFPVALSAIVLKLLAKDPQDRYVDCAELLSDLMVWHTQPEEGALDFWDSDPPVECASLKVPRKMYGRQQFAAAVREQCGFLEQSGAGVMLVDAPAGTGKTSLVQVLEREQSLSDCILVHGRNSREAVVPFSGLMDAFNNLIKYHLMEGGGGIGKLHRQLVEQLGNGIGALIGFLPVLGFFFENLPDAPDLDAVSVGNRLEMQLQKLFPLLPLPAGRSLIVFLDDFHLAAQAEIRLFIRVVSLLRHSRVLFIVASDSDYSAFQDSLLAGLAEQQLEAVEYRLAPLPLNAVQQLLEDMFSSGSGSCASLAVRLHRETGGKPRTLKKYLQYLIDTGFFSRNGRGVWSWDLSRLPRCLEQGVSHDEPELEKLDGPVRRLLALAAALSDPFELELVAAVAGVGAADAGVLLFNAVSSGVIERVSSMAKYSPERFRFRSSALAKRAARYYAAGEWPVVHLQIVRSLSALEEEVMRSNPGDQRLLIILKNCLRAEIPVETAERLLYISWLRQGGQLMLQAGDYQRAVTYLEHARRMLPEDCWRDYYAETLGLYNQLVTGYQFFGANDAVAECVDVMSRHIHRPDELLPAQLNCVKLRLTRDDPGEVISYALTVLGENGVKVPVRVRRSNLLRRAARLERELVGDKSRSLDRHYLCSDQAFVVLSDFITAFLSSLFMMDEDLFCWFCFYILERSIKDGVVPASAYGLGALALFLNRRFDRKEAALYLAGMALSLNSRFSPVSAAVEGMIRGYILHIERPLYQLKPFFDKKMELLALEGGDLESFESAGINSLLFRILIGEYLPELLGYMQQAALDTGRSRLFYLIVALFRQKTDDLVNGPQDGLLCGASLQLDSRLSHPAFTSSPFFESVALGQLLHLMLIYGVELDLGVIIERLSRYPDTVFTSPLRIEYNYYICLAWLRLRQKKRSVPAKSCWKKAYQLLRNAAIANPDNYGHKLELVEAEYAMVRGDLSSAFQNYEAACRNAAKNRFVYDEALAAESAARCYRDADMAESSMQKYRRAAACYREWGALFKAKQLQGAIPAVDVPNRVLPPGGTPSGGSGDNLLRDQEQSVYIKKIASAECADEVLGYGLRMMTESSGATKAVLLIDNGQGWQIAGVAEPVAGSEKAGRIDIQLYSAPCPPGKFPDFPHTLFRRVSFLDGALLYDAGNDQSGVGDNVLDKLNVKSASIIKACSPAGLAMALYLENREIRGVFTPSRNRMLELFLLQTAITVENNLLREDLLQQNENLEQLVDEQTGELRELAAEASRANRAKSAYLSMAAHDMKNPLLIMDLYTNFLENALEESLTDEQRKHLKNIRSGAEQLSHLLDSILDRNRIEAGKLELELEEVELVDLISSCVEAFSSVAEKKGVILQFDPDDQSHLLQADRFRCMQIFNNLINNAVTHTPAGATVEVKAFSQAAWAAVEVVDSGPGLPEEKLRDLFVEYYTTQHGNNENNHYGLGLTIVKMLVEAHGGNITAGNNPEGGAVFRVKLPLKM